ncbi:PQQ-binding-like beta-propeller repeat protein [Streptomyces sp. NPDC056468]|uniref:outer membrane protein assembly factor BamB family protein n=1 Tax=Streptomyces sp. NPDC056468 TaxID=3345830 RepID=UPI0036C20D6A
MPAPQRRRSGIRGLPEARRRRHHRHERDTPRPHHRPRPLDRSGQGGAGHRRTDRRAPDAARYGRHAPHDDLAQRVVGRPDDRTAVQGPARGLHPVLLRGTLYFTLPSGGVRAVAPRTGRQLWESNSTVEHSGPPTASATHLYLASPNGRLAALDVRTGA